MSENEWDSKLKEFFLCDQETKVAVCILCNKNVSFKTTVVNLIQHLALAHPDTLIDSFPIVISNEVERRDDNSDTIKITCDFNSLFDIDQDSEIATCTLCHDNVPNNSTRSHLKRKHVNVYNNFVESESNIKNEENVSEVENCSDEENGSNSNRENSTEELIAEFVTVNNSDEEYLETDEEYMIISPEENGFSTRSSKCSSDLWKHFTRLDRNGRAVCKQCTKIFSFKTSLTNLEAHLKARHPNVYKNYNLSLPKNVSSTPKLPTHRERLLNGIWDVFERIKDTKMAKCTICQNILSYKTTITNLKVHVQKRHPKVYNSFDLSTPNSRNRHSKPRAHWWKFFNRHQNTKNATCRLCKKILSFKSTTFNLKIHLQKAHPLVCHKYLTSTKLSSSQNISEEENNSEEEIGFNTEQGSENLEENNIWTSFERFSDGKTCTEKYSGSEGENSSQRGNDTEVGSGLDENNSELLENVVENNRNIVGTRSKIWKFFKRNPNNKKGTCTLCEKVVSYKTTTTNLKVHIKNKHPYMYFKYLTSSKSASPPRNNFEAHNGSNRRLKNKRLKILKKSESIFGKLHEVYIKAGEHKDQTTKDIALDNEDNTKSVFGDSKLMDPFHEDELINSRELPEKKQRFSSKNRTVNIQQTEKKLIDRCLLKFIVENFHPLKIVDDIGFREFIAKLNPNYQLPTRKMLSKLLPEEFSRRMAKYNQITQHSSSISLTVDCWSSWNMQRFMSVTAHFIDQSTYEFSSVLITCAVLHGQHTAEKIQSELLQVAKKWNITDKIKFIVTDIDTNMISATRVLNWPHFACFARKFNSIVQGALKELDEIVTKVQKIVAYIKSSSLAKEMVRKHQVENQQRAQPKGLSLSIPTRWMTVYEMLKRCSEQQQAVCSTISKLNVEEENDFPLITQEEWECIDQMLEVLKPFVEAATMIASEKYLIAGKAVVLTAELYRVSTDLAEHDFHEPVANLVLKLKNGLSTHFGDLETIEEIAICTLLDPRFKHHAFENQEALLNTKQCILDKIERFNNESKTIKAASSSTVQTNSETNNLFGHFYNKVASTYTPDDTDEFDRYLSANVIPPTECPLRWWKERQSLYPVLSKIFFDSFNIVVTSQPGDRIFSKTGNSISHRRTRLTTSKIDKIMFLNANK